MKTITLVQGSPQWHEFRAKHFTASDASAMMNLSKYKTRNQLLHEKATGEREEITKSKQFLFDKGHKAEELARPITEANIEDDLFPATAISDERQEIACSFDGVTILEDVIWEHKLYNEKLIAYIVEHDDVPDTHWPQLEQQLYVAKAERCVFTVSDGSEENRFDFEYQSQPERLQAVLDGWTQFAKDLSNYTVEPEAPKAEPVVVEAVDNLPALTFDLNKSTLAIQSNMNDYKGRALALIEKAKLPLETESDFGRAEKIVKEFKSAETKLTDLKGLVLGEVQSINTFIADIDEIKESIRQARLLTDKQVKAKKTEIKNSIISKATITVTESFAELNGTYNTQISCSDIGSAITTAIKGKSNLDRIQDAVDGVVAEFNIKRENIDKTLSANLELLKQNAQYRFLFNDWSHIATMECKPFAELVNARIQEHIEAEKQKEVAIRIEAERKAKLKAESEAQAKINAERKAKQEAEAQAEAERKAKEQAQAETVEVKNDLVRQQTYVATTAPSAPPLAQEAVKPANKPQETVTITVDEYKTLLLAQSKLDALINAGVDNWHGYSHAMDLMEA